MLEKRTVNISTGIIFKTVLILLGIWFLYVVRDIVAVLFIAVIVTAAIEPAVNWMHRKKIPRSLAVLAIYVVLFLVLGTIIYFLIPPVVEQSKDFSQNFPTYAEKIISAFRGLENYIQAHNISFNEQSFFQNIGQQLTQSSLTLFSTTLGFFSSFISLIVIISLTFYMSVKEDGMKSFVIAVTPEKYQGYAVSVMEKIKVKIGKWMQGQLLLMLLIFLLDFLALYFLNIPYALILALLGGFLEVVPYLGPIIAAVPAVILGFLISPLTGLLVVAAYTIIQQAESHIITPQVMKKALGLNPIVVILALLIGAKIGGVLGAILSVPITTALSVFVDDLVEKKNE